MKTLRLLMLTAAAAALLTACGPAQAPPADTAADQAAMNTASDSWFKLFGAGNAEGTAAIYADDAVVMPPGAPVVTGKTAILEFITKMSADMQGAGLSINNLKSTSGVFGDMGWHQGSYTVTDKSGAVVDSGSYMEAWMKKDGQWHIIRDIWNSDRPPAPAPPAAAAPAGEAPAATK
jgi:ketosteroid isomerase-like protein